MKMFAPADNIKKKKGEPVQLFIFLRITLARSTDARRQRKRDVVSIAEKNRFDMLAKIMSG